MSYYTPCREKYKIKTPNGGCPPINDPPRESGLSEGL